MEPGHVHVLAEMVWFDTVATRMPMGVHERNDYIATQGV